MTLVFRLILGTIDADELAVLILTRLRRGSGCGGGWGRRKGGGRWGGGGGAG